MALEIRQVDGLYEGSITDADTRTAHFVMSGPPRPYGEVVEELLDALRRRLLSPGE